MSNKTSDENVANIERLNNFANMTFLYGNRVNLNVSGLKEIQNDIKNILSDYTRQKQINEEHKKLNGELRERVKELEEENKENKKKYLALLIGQFPDTTETYKKYKKELQKLLQESKDK